MDAMAGQKTVQNEKLMLVLKCCMLFYFLYYLRMSERRDKRLLIGQITAPYFLANSMQAKLASQDTKDSQNRQCISAFKKRL